MPAWWPILAPYLAGVVIQRYSADLGMRLLYTVMLAIYLGSAFIVLRFLKEPSASPRQPLRLPVLVSALRQAYQSIPGLVGQMPRSLKALALVVLSFVINGLTGSFWVVYATERAGLTIEEWGLILLLESLVRLGLFLPAGVWVDRRGRTASLNVALAIFTLATPLFTWLHGFTALLLVRLVMSAASVLGYLACIALMADLTPSRMRGQNMAALGQGGIELGAVGAPGGPSVGYLIIPPVMLASLGGGYLYTLNPASPWIVAAGAGLLALLLSLVFIRDPDEKA